MDTPSAPPGCTCVRRCPVICTSGCPRIHVDAGSTLVQEAACHCTCSRRAASASARLRAASRRSSARPYSVCMKEISVHRRELGGVCFLVAVHMIGQLVRGPNALARAVGKRNRE